LAGARNTFFSRPIHCLSVKQIRHLLLPGLAITWLATGCRGVPAAGETSARHELAMVGGQLRTPSPPPAAGATLRDYELFAVRQHPEVAAAYADWAASVENITVARSWPDPKLTFELYAADALSSLMPGLSMDIPGPGKLAARAAVASAESRAKYFAFATTVQQTAFEVAKNFYPLYYLDARLQVNRQSLALLASLEALARAQNEVNRASLQDVLKAQIERDKLSTETENLEDSRRVLLAKFKAALGLRREDADPPAPANAEFIAAGLSDDALFAAALSHNPRLQELTSEIGLAEANIRMANKDKIPDFTTGFEVDAKAAPAVWNPQFSATLPIWRDKLAAEIAAARNDRGAAAARLSAEQINLAADFAEQTYLIREASRELALLRERLLPRARESLEVTRAAYRSGQVDFLNVIDAERALLDFQLDEIAAQTQRATAGAELALLVAGTPPENAPLLAAPTASAPTIH
jgi:outer membrane protein TolC